MPFCRVLYYPVPHEETHYSIQQALQLYHRYRTQSSGMEFHSSDTYWRHQHENYGNTDFSNPIHHPSNSQRDSAYIVGGTSQNALIHMKIFTEQSHTRRFEKYLSVQTWNQNAHTMTADNMWFPLTRNRRVYLSLSTTTVGSLWGHIYVIGYR